MDKSLYFNGIKYISARRAATIVGYSNDYVGQLCRSGKIDSTLVGRGWYVSEESILRHKEKNHLEKNTSSKKKTLFQISTPLVNKEYNGPKVKYFKEKKFTPLPLISKNVFPPKPSPKILFSRPKPQPSRFDKTLFFAIPLSLLLILSLVSSNEYSPKLTNPAFALGSILDWTGNAVSKILEPWFGEDVTPATPTISPTPNTSPIIVNQYAPTPSTTKQAIQTFNFGETKSYIDASINSGFASLRQEFLTSTTLPNVNRYYITRQLEAIVGRTGSGSSSSGSSGISLSSLSASSPIVYDNSTGAFSLDFSTNNTWTGTNEFNTLTLTGQTGCLQADGSGNITGIGVNCGSGGGGSGGGSWATTTSTVAGRLINYPLNTSDIIVIGGVSTTTGATEYWFDPNTQNAHIGSSVTASTTIMGNATTTGSLSVGAINVNGDYISDITGSGLSVSGNSLTVSGLTTSNFSSPNVSQFTNDAGYLTSTFAFPFTVNANYNSTSTTLGLLNGFFSTASSTQSGNFFLPSLTQGLAYTGTNGLINTTATTTASCSGSTSCSAFTILGSAPVTITSTDSTASSTLLSDTNSWTGVNRFSLASTTYASFGTASTTNLIINNSSFNSLLGSGLSNSSGALTVSGLTTSNFSSPNISQFTNDSGYKTFNFPFTVSTNYNSTSTVIGFNGLFSTASSTFGSSLYLPSLTQGLAYIGSNGLAQTISSSTIKTSWLTNDSGFLSSYDPFTHPASGISATTSQLNMVGFLSTASSTIIGNATTTGSVGAGALYINGDYITDFTGSNLSVTNGVLSATGGSSFAFPFTPTSYGVSTSTTIGFLNGLFSTASSTFGSSLYLPSLTQGLAYTGTNGLINTTATTTASCTGDASCTPFTILGSSPVTISATAGASSVSGTGFTGMATYWTASNTVGATSTLSINNFIATSSTAINTFPRLATTYASSTYSSFDTASTTNLILNNSSFNSLLGSGLSNSSGSLTVSGLTTSNFSSPNISQFTNDAGYLTSTFAFPFTPTSYGVSTSTTVGFLNGLFSTASSTFGSSVFLPSLAVGTLNVGTNGLLYSGATTTFGSGYATTTQNSVAFSTSTQTLNGITYAQNITATPGAITFTPNVSGTLTVGGGGTGQTAFTSGQLIYGVAGGALQSVATSSASCSSGISCSGFTVVGSVSPTITNSGVLSVQHASGSAQTGSITLATSTTAINNDWGITNSSGTFTFNIPSSSATVRGLLTAADWTTFNNKSSFAFPFTSVTGYNSTSTVIGFNGLFSTASSTFGSSLYLPSLTQGIAYTGTNGLINTTATTTASCSGSTSCSAFTILGSAPVTITSTDSTASSTLLSDTNSWTGVNRFSLASTTYASFGTASTTNLNLGGQTFISLLGTGLSNSGGILTNTGLLSYDAWTHPAAGQSATTSLMVFNGAASSTLLSANFAQFGGTGTTSITSAGWVGIASSSPWAQLSVNPNALGSGVPEFVIGSSTATHFLVTGSGNVGIGTAVSPLDNFSVVKSGGSVVANFTSYDSSSAFSEPYIDIKRSRGTEASPSAVAAGDELGQIRFFGRSGSGATGFNEFSAVIRSVAEAAPAGLHVPAALAFDTDSGVNQIERMRITGNGNVGIGTTSPGFRFQIASSTANGGFKPQLALSDSSAGTNAKHWTLASEGGNIYFGTSTDLYATTSISALEISGSGFGTTTVRGLNISGAQATSTSNVGLSITSGCYAIGNTCLSASAGLSSYDAWTHPVAGQSATTSLMMFNGAASSTLLSANWAKFGSTGSTTIDVTGLLTGDYSSSTIYASFLTSSSTFANAGTLTVATSSAGCAAFMTSGVLVSTGSACGTSSGLSSYDAWTHPAAGQSATTSLILLNGQASSTQFSSSIGYFNNIFATSTTQFSAFGASTTPFAQLSINSIAGSPSFNIGSSTGTYFIVDKTGNVGVGTSSPTAKLHVSLTDGDIRFGDITADANTDTGLMMNGAGSLESALFTEVNGAILSYGINVPQITSRNTSSVGGIFRFDTRSNIVFSGGGQAFSVIGYPTGGSVATNRLLISLQDGTTALAPAGGFVGVSTTSPGFLFQVASTTASATFKPQLALSDSSAGTNAKHWTLASEGGNIYFGTSTDLYATTSISALEISGSGFGTTTVRGLNISGAQATSTSNVGLSIATGCYAIGTTCIGSGGGSNPGGTGTELQFRGGASTFSALTGSAVDNTGGFLGIGTTTPKYLLNLATTTAPQLVLSGAGEDTPWTMRSIGGALYFATASPLTLATSSETRFTIASNGFIGVGIDNPSDKLVVSGAGAVRTSIVTTSATGFAGFLLTGEASSNLESIQYGSGYGGTRWGHNNASSIQLLGYGAGTSFMGIGTLNTAPLVLGVNDAEAMILVNGGSIGIGTTSPGFQFQVASTTANGGFKPQLALTDTGAGTNAKHWTLASEGGNLYFGTSTDLYATTSISALQISGSGFGTTTLRGLNISGQATSTSNVGMSITTGCYAIGTTCLSGSSASTTLLADFNTFSNTNNFTGKVGLASSTPWAKLSVNSAAGEPAFAVGSSTFTSFVVDKNGYVGIGTTTLGAFVTIVGPTAYTGQLFEIASSTGDTFFHVMANGKIGIGTATPAFKLQISSTTQPQLALSGSNTDAPWTFRSIGNNLYISTSSPTTFATSSLSALSFLSNGNVGFGTSSPNSLFIVASSSGPMFTINADSPSTNSGIDITAGASQVGQLLAFKNSAGAFLSGFSGAGGLMSYISSTTAMYINDSSGNPSLVVDTSNLRVGVGTSTPSYNFSVSSTSASIMPAISVNSVNGTTTIGIFTATTTGLVAGQGVALAKQNNILIIGDGFSTSSLAMPRGSICLDWDGWCTAATNTPLGYLSARGSKMAASDLAEMYNSADRLVSGDIVEFSGVNNVKKVGPNTDPKNVVGIVSTDPGITLGSGPDYNGGGYPIALSGRVPVNVSNISGAIKAGDYLTISTTTPNTAVKAVSAGYVIGQALTDYNGPVAGKSQVMAFVKNIYYAGDTSPTNSNFASNMATTSIFINQNGSGNFLIADNGVTQILAGTQTGDETVFSIKYANTDAFTINGYGDVKIAGQIYASTNTAGTALMVANATSTHVTFDRPYEGAPKIVVTPQSVPAWLYGVVDKDGNGFTIGMSSTTPTDLSFDWIALYQPNATQSTSTPVVITNTVVNIPSSVIIISPPDPNSGSITTSITNITATSSTSTTTVTTASTTPAITPAIINPTSTTTDPTLSNNNASSTPSS